MTIEAKWLAGHKPTGGVRNRLAISARKFAAAAVWFTLAGLLGISSLPAWSATTYSWIGAQDHLWSNPDNWSPIGTPASGDTLAFPSGVPHKAMQNDLPAGTAYGSLVFAGNGYTLGGNALSVSGGIDALVNSGNAFNVPVVLTAAQTVRGGTYNQAFTLNADVTVASEAFFNGPVDVGAHAWSFTNGLIVVAGPVSGSGTITTAAACLPGCGIGGPVFMNASNPFSGSFIGINGWLDGAAFPNASFTGPSLLGKGSIGGAVTVRAESAAVSSSFNPTGALGTGNLVLGNPAQAPTLFNFGIDGAVAGAGHFPVTTTGTVNLANVDLQLHVGSALVASVGHVFTIINNGSATPVTGTFIGKAENDELTLGGMKARISYTGGDGNDVTLTVTYAPRIWTGAVSNLWSLNGNWESGAPQAGDTLQFPSGAAHKAMQNDLPAGTVYGSLVFAGGNYTLGGNALWVSGGIDARGSASNVFNVPVVLTAAQTVSGGVYNQAFTLHADVTVDREAFFNGPVDVGPHDWSFNGGLIGVIGPVSGSGTISTATACLPGCGIGGPIFQNPGNPFSGSFSGLNALLDGAVFPNASYIGPSLNGKGSIGGAVTVRAESAAVSSSFNPTGALSTGSLVLGNPAQAPTLFNFSINGAVAGAGYFPVTTTGTVHLANVDLHLHFGSGLVASLGQELTIISNGSATPITGTFIGKAENDEFTLGGMKARLSYQGGDGNDVTLKITFAPRIWTGALGNLWSQAGNWNGGVAPQAGDALRFPSGAAHKTMQNDLPAGTVFGSLVFAGNGYTLGGNALSVSGGLDAQAGSGNTFDVPVVLTAAQTVSGGIYNQAFTLNADVTVDRDGFFKGPVEVGPHSWSFNAGLIGVIGPVSGSGTITTAAACLPGCGIGGPVFMNASNPFSGSFIGINGWLDGAAFPNASFTGPSLLGKGSIGGAVTVRAESAAVSSAFNPTGALSTGNLVLGNPAQAPTLFNFSIQGALAGVGTVPVTTTGTVHLANVELQLHAGSAFVPTKGEMYKLIDKIAPGAVIGTFKNKPEGFPFTLNTVYDFKLTYIGGDGNDVAVIALTGKEPSMTTLAASANPSLPGTTVTLTATVSGAGGTPTGQVTFKDGANTIGTANLGSGVATLAVATLAPGSHSITATYAGDPAFGGSTSPALAHTVETVPGAQAITFTSSPPATAVAGGPTYTVTATGGASGNPVTFSIDAATAAVCAISGPTVSFNAAGTCTINANQAGNSSYAAAPQAVQSFAVAGGTSFAAPSPTGTGPILASVSGGGSGCSYSNAEFTIPASPPSGVDFPHGMFNFTVSGCGPASALTFTITYPATLPAGAQYWKFGPTPGDNTPHWYILPAAIAGNVVTFTIEDGALGDDDLTVNGVITDDGGIAAPNGTVAFDADIDANDVYEPLADGLLAIRYLFGLSGPSLTRDALGAHARLTDPAAVLAHLEDIRPMLDIDGNGSAEPLTDGIMLLRYLFGLRGNPLIEGAVGPNATRRTASEIATWIESLLP